ncbi:SRPBCC family protein [Rhizobium sp. CFBP 8752]|uniref:SRPBCC family protein n=1 Tax=Rhizobium sp. CFBP 8752 TaxID=2775301 RepID=UPI00177C2E33|nr:SRPBCC family protein [Rhizobium sp. CFBP 8752]MBD8662569.1 SRPBCC family protein [Rhizobium sp. CFBP 8752]
MTDMTSLSRHAFMTEPLALTIQRKLPGPIERIWDYVTDSDLRRQWLASGTMPRQPGGTFELVWRNDELSDDPAGRPEGFPEEQRMESEMIAFEAPHRVVFSWPPSGEVSIELQAVGKDVLLTLTHRRISDRRNMVMVGAGWHAHLDILEVKAAGQNPAAFWPAWLRLREEYEAIVPA